MALEREYNVPLRKEWLKVPKYKRAKKAVVALKQFLVKHMKSEDVKLGKHVNEKIWGKGIRNPPHHVKITAVKDDEGKVVAELTGIKIEAKKEKLEEKAKEASNKAESAKEEPVQQEKPVKENPGDKGSEKAPDKVEAKKANHVEAPKTKVQAKEEGDVKPQVKAPKSMAK